MRIYSEEEEEKKIWGPKGMITTFVERAKDIGVGHRWFGCTIHNLQPFSFLQKTRTSVADHISSRASIVIGDPYNPKHWVGSSHSLPSIVFLAAVEFAILNCPLWFKKVKVGFFNFIFQLF